MTTLEEMRKEMDILRNEVEFQRKLAEYWEGRWKQEYAEKIELLRQNVELEKKCKENPRTGQAATSHAHCGYCGKVNHVEAECWRKQGKCFKCGSTEHKFSNCPGNPIKKRKYSAAS